MADIPDELIKLEHSVEEERAKCAGLAGEEYEAQCRRWREASKAAQAAITKYAQTAGQDHYEVEQAVKKAVRRAEEDPAD